MWPFVSLPYNYWTTHTSKVWFFNQSELVPPRWVCPLVNNTLLALNWQPATDTSQEQNWIRALAFPASLMIVACIPRYWNRNGLLVFVLMLTIADHAAPMVQALVLHDAHLYDGRPLLHRPCHVPISVCVSLLVPAARHHWGCESPTAGAGGFTGGQPVEVDHRSVL